MSRLFVTVAAATALLAIAPAQAKEQGNFYVGGGVGVVFAGNTRADGVFTSTGTTLDGQRLGPAPGQTASGNFDPSLTTSVIVGYDMGKRRFGRFRFEAELLYQKADTDKYLGLLDGNELDPAGRVDTTVSGVVVNALYDIGTFGAVTPYLFAGFGEGKVTTKYDFQSLGQVEIDGTSNAGILQAGFGADIPFNERTTIDLKYRFRRAGLNEGGLDTDIDAQSLAVGFRYAF